MDYKIKEEVLQAVLNYLATKPYSEVFQLVTALQSSEKIEKKVEPKKEKK